jgi:hypothetical protein
MKYSLILVLALLTLTGCQKELSFENGLPVEKETTRKYQLRDFYSDVPIDFVEYDTEVKSETELWAYVRDYLKDDVNEFYLDSSLVRVYQNELKIPGNDAPVLDKLYAIGTDAEGPYMNFLGPDYEPLKYRIQEYNEDYFILYLNWKDGSTVYSRFERIK